MVVTTGAIGRAKSGADLEGGVGEGKSGGLGDGSPQWGPGAKPRQGVWGMESPRSWSILKIHNLNFKAL